jgi:hypothetical protein
MGIVLKFRHALAGTVRPKIAGSASLPRSRRAAVKTKKCSEGILPRAFQLDGAEPDLMPTKLQAAIGPPTASMTSATELSIPNEYSRPVILSSPHGERLGFRLPMAKLGRMVTKAKLAQRQEAARLNRAQEALELTNEALAEKIGVTPHAWSQDRTGARPISRAALHMLRRDHGITADYIIFDDPSKLPQDVYAKIRVRGAA